MLRSLFLMMSLSILLVISGCGGGGGTGGNGNASTTGDNGNVSTTAQVSLTPPPVLLSDPAQIAAALSKPETVNLGVWSLIEQLGLGVYTASGSLVLDGYETSDSDFWLYDFEVPLLAKMALDKKILFSEYHAKLSVYDLNLTAAELLSSYRSVYEEPVNANAFLARVQKEMGLTFEGDPLITPLQEFLLLLDRFVPDDSSIYGNDAPVQTAKAMGGACVLDYANRKNKAWKLGRGVQKLYTAINTGAGLAKVVISPADLVSAFILQNSVSTALTASHTSTHEKCPKEPSPPHVMFTAKAMIDVNFPIDEVPCAGHLKGVKFPSAGPMKDLMIRWNAENPLIQKHGYWSNWPAPPAAPRTKINGSGLSTIEFEPKREAASGIGNINKETIKVTAVFETQLYDIPTSLSAMAAKVFVKLVQDRTESVNFEVEWHEEAYTDVLLNGKPDGYYEVWNGVPLKNNQTEYHFFKFYDTQQSGVRSVIFINGLTNQFDLGAGTGLAYGSIELGKAFNLQSLSQVDTAGISVMAKFKAKNKTEWDSVTYDLTNLSGIGFCLDAPGGDQLEKAVFIYSNTNPDTGHPNAVNGVSPKGTYLPILYVSNIACHKWKAQWDVDWYGRKETGWFEAENGYAQYPLPALQLSTGQYMTRYPAPGKDWPASQYSIPPTDYFVTSGTVSWSAPYIGVNASSPIMDSNETRFYLSVKNFFPDSPGTQNFRYRSAYLQSDLIGHVPPASYVDDQGVTHLDYPRLFPDRWQYKKISSDGVYLDMSPPQGYGLHVGVTGTFVLQSGMP